MIPCNNTKVKVFYDRPERISGEQNLQKMIKLALNGLVQFTSNL